MKHINTIIGILAAAFIICACVKTGINYTYPPLDTPTNLTAIQASPYRAYLHWNNTVTFQDGFRIERKTATSNYILVDTTERNITDYLDKTLSPDTTYTYRICAYNIADNLKSYSNEVSIKTINPWIELKGANDSGFNNNINSLTTDASGKTIYAVGDFGNALGYYYVAKWNGTNWSELGGTNSTTFNGNITSIKNDVDNNLYAIGIFRNTNSNIFVAKWNGTSWSELGGINSINFKGNIVGINSIAIDPTKNVYVANIGTDYPSTYWFPGPIYKFDGNNWSSISDSIHGYNMSKITVDNSGNLYAFDGNGYHNYMQPKYIYEWDRTKWTKLPATINHFLKYITTDASGNVYTTGDYGDGVPVVVKWNGSTWTQLGGTNFSFNGPINCIITDPNGNVYAAGSFTNANNNFYVAKWDGTSWSELGGTNTSVLNSYINSIAIDAVGNVYAAGSFTNSKGRYYVAMLKK